jgi:hypothetical protein
MNVWPLCVATGFLIRRKSLIIKVEERGGFEPPVLFRYSRFPGVRLKPLSHLSSEKVLVKVNHSPASRNVFP